jgi:RNA polymerase sigma-70 factor (ECF subfamily)
MGGREPSANDAAPAGRPVVYCLIPRDLAPKLHELVRRHFADDPLVAVVVERRDRERRRGADRRKAVPARSAEAERRRIRAVEGRRVGERRAALVTVDGPSLPRRVREHAERLVFVERIEPADLAAEDADTARLVAQIQAGDRDGFAVLYMRYFDRVYGYLRLVLRDPTSAEDATQHVFTQVIDALPRYERRRQPFRAWLFTVVRHHALAELKRSGRVELTDPGQIATIRDEASELEPGPEALNWITDRELLMFVERLPLAQRQVLVLRYMLDLSHAEIAQVLGRSHTDVRVSHSRAVSFLRERLCALGREGRHDERVCAQRTKRYATVLRARRYALIRH